MDESNEMKRMRRAVALLRITVGVVLLATWVENFTTGIYTADGITGLFNWIFNDTGGGPPFYRAAIEATILRAPGLFAAFQLVAELLLALGLIFGFLTPLIALGATFFFLNLFFAFLGGTEWIWTYVLLTVAALVAAVTHSGRAWGVDQYLLRSRGQPRLPLLW